MAGPGKRGPGSARPFQSWRPGGPLKRGLGPQSPARVKKSLKTPGQTAPPRGGLKNGSRKTAPGGALKSAPRAFNTGRCPLFSRTAAAALWRSAGRDEAGRLTSGIAAPKGPGRPWRPATERKRSQFWGGRSILRPSSISCLKSAAPGAPVVRHWAFWVLGKAMTSLREGALAISITSRSRPKAQPP